MLLELLPELSACFQVPVGMRTSVTQWDSKGTKMEDFCIPQGDSCGLLVPSQDHRSVDVKAQ